MVGAESRVQNQLVDIAEMGVKLYEAPSGYEVVAALCEWADADHPICCWWECFRLVVAADCLAVDNHMVACEVVMDL
jgi:hypothetical protein